jgi:hypothetical protein
MKMSGLTRKLKLGDDGKLYLNGSALGGGVTGGAPDEKKLTTTPTVSTPTVSTPTVSTPNSSIEDAIAMLNNGSHKENTDDYMNRYKNHTFNFNANALYNQYAPQYQKQARLGMEDAIGRAAALTGGYGSSYAQAVGQQAYYNQMDKLDDRILDLYNIAYGQYRDEKNDLLGMANYYNGLAQQDYDNAMALIGKMGEYEDDKKPEPVPMSVLDAIQGITNNQELDKVLSGFSIAGQITEDQAGKLYNEYKDMSYKGMLTDPVNDWDIVSMGDNANWFGIDRDVTVRMPNGEEIMLKDLRKHLMNEGMKLGEANKAIKHLLKTLKLNK